MKHAHMHIVDAGFDEPSFITTRFDDAVKYHVQLNGRNVGSVLRFTDDDRASLGWYATPDDCTGGPRSGNASDYRWAGGFRTRRDAVAYLRGCANVTSAWRRQATRAPSFGAGEVDNARRAEFARHALRAFGELTGQAGYDLSGAEEFLEIAGDLVANLMHAANAAGVTSAELVNRAERHYEAEAHEDD